MITFFSGLQKKVIKGLARRCRCLRHDARIKYVDVSLGKLSGYSPMMAGLYRTCPCTASGETIVTMSKRFEIRTIIIDLGALPHCETHDCL